MDGHVPLSEAGVQYVGRGTALIPLLRDLDQIHHPRTGSAGAMEHAGHQERANVVAGGLVPGVHGVDVFDAGESGQRRIRPPMMNQ